MNPATGARALLDRLSVDGRDYLQLRELHTAFPQLEGAERLEIFLALPPALQDTAWDWLAASVDASARAEERDDMGPFIDLPPRVRRVPPRHTPSARSARFDRDDALRTIDAVGYYPVLLNTEIRGTYVSCPVPDHDDRNPSCHLGPGEAWYCHSCHVGGSIYDMAALVWGYGLPLKGPAFVDVHRRLLDLFARRRAAA